MIFVFGSNLAGIHGAGAANFAWKYEGADWGVGKGRTGNSYAIPTKDENIKTLPIQEVALHIAEFLQYAALHPFDLFKVTKIGCGLAGFKDSEIAPMFQGATPNCIFDLGWKEYLDNLPTREYWGKG